MWKLVVAALLAVLVSEIGKGGLRWRRLTTAGHELDVAKKLAPDSALRTVLVQRAEARLERYVRGPRVITEHNASTWSWMITGVVALIVVCILLAVIPGAGDTAVRQVGIGGAFGVLVNLGQPYVLRFLVKRMPAAAT